MPFRWNPREHLSHGRYVVKWMVLLTPLSVTIGAACALFLWLLDRATATRFDHPWLLYLLPLAGVPMVWVYDKLGRGSDKGNNLIIEEIHKPGGGVPARMAPIVLIATLATHLFGGSAGREGTAVQMGGSIASAYGRLIPRFSHADTRTLLMAGVAAGFAGVFGTPIAGTFFAIEVLALGQLSYAAAIPCLFAAIVADRVCHAFNIHHTVYHLTTTLSHDGALLMLKVAGAAVLFGLTGMFFAELAHSLHRIFAFICRPTILRPLIGGLLIIALVHLLGTRDYLGIGIVSPEPGGVSILSAFNEGGAHPWSWWWKCLFTAITLSVGFKGGEVTPLFFIGATLGNTLAWLFHAPVDLFAALGFVAVFAGATNTPLACTIMAVELFGPQNAVYFAVACFIAYLFSGHTGIYVTQRIGVSKSATLAHEQGQTLLTSREQRPRIMSLLRRACSRLNFTRGKE